MEALSFCQRFQKFGLSQREIAMLAKFVSIDREQKTIILRVVSKVRPKKSNYFKTVASNKAKLSPVLVELVKMEAKANGYKLLIINNM